MSYLSRVVSRLLFEQNFILRRNLFLYPVYKISQRIPYKRIGLTYQNGAYNIIGYFHWVTKCVTRVMAGVFPHIGWRWAMRDRCGTRTREPAKAFLGTIEPVTTSSLLAVLSVAPYHYRVCIWIYYTYEYCNHQLDKNEFYMYYFCFLYFLRKTNRRLSETNRR